MSFLLNLKEYIRFLVKESRIREADISDDRKVPWGSDDHVSDLTQRLSRAEYWRNKYPKGSEKRAHYRNVLTHIKNELKSAQKANQVALNEKEKS